MDTGQVEQKILEEAKLILKNRSTTPIALERHVTPEASEKPRGMIRGPEYDVDYGDGFTATVYEHKVVVGTYEAVRFVLSNIERVPDERTQKIKRLEREVLRLEDENERLKERCEQLSEMYQAAMKLPSH